MALKISHSNLKNTHLTIQVKTSEEGDEAISVRFGPHELFYTDVEFITSSMRIMESKKMIKIEKVDFIPPAVKEHVPSTQYPLALDEKEEVVLDAVNEGIDEIRSKIKKESLIDRASKQVEEYKSDKPKEEKKSSDEPKEEFKSGRWEPEEDAYLKRYYPTKGAKYVADYLNRTEKSVQKKAEVLKLKKRKKKKKK